MLRLSIADRQWTRLGLLAVSLSVLGCGTTRMTDTSRAASEMLLISQAVDEAVAQIDFSPLSEQTVFLDTSAMDKDTVDKGYLVSVVRQQLLAQGALLQDERSRAVYVVEIRSGGLGTNRHSLLVGSPAMSIPTVVPGLPSANIPELALVKRSDQRGIAKIAVFAYNRISGRALWQSGTVLAMSHSKDTWVFGAGPFSRGTIRQRTELAGEPLPSLPDVLSQQPVQLNGGNKGLSDERLFPASASIAPPPVLPSGVLGATGTAVIGNMPVVQ